MAKLTRRESEVRQQAVLNFFLNDPTATGEEAQKALETGKLTGKKEARLGIAKMFSLKKQAQELLDRGVAPPPVHAAAVPKGSKLSHAAGSMARLRELTAELRAVLNELPDIQEVHVTRLGAKLQRAVTREEVL